MKTEDSGHTLQGVIRGYRFRVAVTNLAEDVFLFTATVEGVVVEARGHGLIRNKGDAMQLAIAAVEKHIAQLASED